MTSDETTNYGHDMAWLYDSFSFCGVTNHKLEGSGGEEFIVIGLPDANVLLITSETENESEFLLGRYDRDFAPVGDAVAFEFGDEARLIRHTLSMIRIAIEVEPYAEGDRDPQR